MNGVSLEAMIRFQPLNCASFALPSYQNQTWYSCPCNASLGLSIAFLGDQWCCGAALQFGALTNHHSRRFVRTASASDQHHRHCLLKVLTLKRCAHPLLWTTKLACSKRLLLHISQKKDTFLLPLKWPFRRSINAMMIHVLFCGDIMKPWNVVWFQFHQASFPCLKWRFQVGTECRLCGGLG